VTEIVLTGLDGSQLLGFVGSLGILDILSRTETSISEAPRLGWRHAGAWRPVVSGTSSIEALADVILRDARSALVEDILEFTYLKVEKRGPKAVRALTPPVSVLRAWTSAKLEAGRWQLADYASCLMCETASEAIVDDKIPNAADLASAQVAFDRDVPLDRATLPTPFDFTSRNTQFLDQVRRVREALTHEALLKELRDGVGAPSDRIMRWDTLTDLPAALFSRVQPSPRPAAEWLVFRGLPLFALTGSGGRIGMAGLTGRRKAGRFAWVLWDGMLPRDLVRTTLTCASLLCDPAEREARGCVAAFAVRLIKDATGYDGSVSPGSWIEASS